MGTYTGTRVLETHAGYYERWVIYRQVWSEYGLRAGLIILIVVTVTIFIIFELGEGEYLQLPKPVDVAALIFGILSLKALVAVVGFDVFVLIYMRSEIWRMNASDESKELLQTTLLHLAKVFDIGGFQQAFRRKTLTEEMQNLSEDGRYSQKSHASQKATIQ